jgi:hypothetical protein
MGQPGIAELPAISDSYKQVAQFDRKSLTP